MTQRGWRLLPLVSVSLLSCSLIFSEGQSTQGTPTTDAAIVDNEYPCGETLPGTIAILSVDGDEGSELLKTRLGAELGEVVLLDSGDLIPSELDVASGPSTDCGDAVKVTSKRLGDYVRISNSTEVGAGQGVHAIDFWFRAGGPLISPQMGTLLSKDRADSNQGDLTVSMFPYDGEHFIIMRLQDEGSTFVACSEAVPVRNWHHVAISVDENDGASLYVDGQVAENLTPVTPLEADIGGPILCADGPTASTARFVNFSANPNDWLWGAGNFKYDPGNPSGTQASVDVMLMDIDELRFRSQPFEVPEAMDAYNAVLDPAL